jgi:Gamma-glutamyl cyclotransferase, AIG2-like
MRPGFVFAYGTLQVPDVLLRVLGRVPELVPASVSGFRRCCFVDASYPGAIPDTAGTLRGRLLGPLSPGELATLHHYEGERYVPVPCRVEDAGPPGVDATLYVVSLPFRSLLTPLDWDLDRWLELHGAAFVADT